MSKGTPLRNIRVPDDLWGAVVRKAQDEGRSVSEVVREMLTAYAKPSD